MTADRVSITSVLFVALLALTTTSAFAPVPVLQRFPTAISAALVDGDAYDAFVPGESKELTAKDEIVGDGDEAKEGSMLTVSFKGRTMTTGVTQSVEKFTFKLGSNDNVMEGWHQGLPGMKTGGTRLLRIPNGDLTKGGGDEDMEFEIELLSVSEGAVNEFLVNNGLGANGKTFGLIALLVLSAIIPQLEKAGIIN
eukprot:CAMPEP_0183302702 /NCGR_PEP_ID=MMETSP0160_2-20130417/8392_1 /TAXON_ID=2839 ORGANISM="Odontella Sinensis, Strain Grunow 1884" /NCGR_SAMPLE_ID=MMETSP0160_2 /ASSEMBLY_ACC=CAM_ASM_000250 /LENGTH=195 /DNA_ID=CAMNT_0025465505 /DNA_START=75 /DNA_END=662 /DNA_ORIENTATION=-